MFPESQFMSECVRRAENARGFTKTNPLVGAAVVKDGKAVSYGIHEKWGGPHAEINAIAAAGSEARGAHLYVTLEPCSTYGKTPPCVESIIEAGIKKVFIGVIDPNPAHRGAGVLRLKEAGIEVELGMEAEKCAFLIEDFIKSQLSASPYVTLKIAMSADGKIATKKGDSKWVTSEESRMEVHSMRSASGAIMIGVGTVLEDDPMLNNRLENPARQPLRAILDTDCRIPLESKLLRSAKDIPLIVFVSEDAPEEKIAAVKDMGAEVAAIGLRPDGLDVTEALKELYKRDVMNVLVEGGSAIFGSFSDADAADALELFIAPKIIGGSGALSPIGGSGKDFMHDVAEFASMEGRKIGRDFWITARIKDYVKEILNITSSFGESS